MDFYNGLVAIFMGHIYFSQHVKAEVFTSTFQLGEQFQIEQSLDVALQSYIKEEQKRLKKLKTFLRLKRQDSRKRSSDLEQLNGSTINPVNVFATLNQFGKDWENVGNQLREAFTHREEFLKVLSRQNESIVSSMDFDGAKDALLRLNEVYDISPQTLTLGKIDNRSATRVHTQGRISKRSRRLTGSFDQKKINNRSQGKIDKQSSTNRLTAMDNFRIGRQAYVNGQRKLAKIWMENTISMMGTQSALRDISEHTDRNDVLNHLGFLEYQFANYNKSLMYYREMSLYDPFDEVLMENIKSMERLVANNTVGKPLSDDDEDGDESMVDYIYQCRNANQAIPLPSNDATLTCRYDNKHPGLYLKPSRVETLSTNPRIELFRNVLSTNEVDELISLARPMLLRAGVNNLETGKPETVDYRISKSAWLRDEDGDLIGKINQRVGALTGLNVDTAEQLQVNNYGLGGQYEPHFDHATNMSVSSIANLGTGNRIATLMFYLSDVQAGGSTVFVKTGVRSKPNKGDALFWYNLKKSGEGDMDTLHAGCPVLLGDKWVANKWIHEYGNEFVRPCGLTEDE